MTTCVYWTGFNLEGCGSMDYAGCGFTTEQHFPALIAAFSSVFPGFDFSTAFPRNFKLVSASVSWVLQRASRCLVCCRLLSRRKQHLFPLSFTWMGQTVSHKVYIRLRPGLKDLLKPALRRVLLYTWRKHCDQLQQRIASSGTAVLYISLPVIPTRRVQRERIIL